MSKVINSLRIVKKATVDGEVALISSGPLKLGGLHRSRIGCLTFEYLKPPNARLREATLEIAITTATEPSHVRWRLWFNSFPLTREFKPQTTIELKEEYFNKVLFDVTPILHARETEEVKLAIKYDGPGEAEVNHANLILVFEAKEAKSSYTYFSGALIIPPNQTSRFNVPLKIIDEHSGELKAIALAKSKYSSASISVNGVKVFSLSTLSDLEEIQIENIMVKPDNEVEVKHEIFKENTIKKPLNISTFILASTKILRPHIKIKSIRIVSEGKEPRLLVKIANTGKSCPDKLWLLLIDTGIIVSRLKLPCLKPGEERDIELPFKTQLKVRQHLLSLRTVWTKLSRVYSEEVRLINVSTS